MAEFDHFLAGALAVMSLSLLLKKAAPASPLARRDFYAAAATTGIVLGGIALLLWHLAGRDLGEFGLMEWIGDTTVTALAAVGWLLMLLVWLMLVRRGGFGEWLRGIYSRYGHLMPVTRGDLLGSWVASVCAGAGEEIVYRGFLLWYGANLVGLPLALLGTSILFGVAHGYQSRFGVMFATAAGLVLATIYLASGSLVLVMWMHASYNVASFTSGRLVLRRKSPTPGELRQG